jgi:hypothetical protein
MSTETSIGPGPNGGGNEDHGNADGLGNKTLGEHGLPEPEVGNDVAGQAAPVVPAGVAGGKANPGIAKGPQSYPDGPNVEASPWELDAARGKPHGGERKPG